MKTPCIAVCRKEDGICVGCKRTVSEINQWKSMTDQQRVVVMDRIKSDQNCAVNQNVEIIFYH